MKNPSIFILILDSSGIIVLAMIKNENLNFKDGQAILTCEATGDLGFIKEYQFTKLSLLRNRYGFD